MRPKNFKSSDVSLPTNVHKCHKIIMMYKDVAIFIKEPVCDTVDDNNDNRLTHFKTPLRLRAGGVINRTF